MNVNIKDSALVLDAQQTIELIDAKGVTAMATGGCLWVTMDGDRRDLVLVAGDELTIERDGRTLIHAHAPSTVRIIDARGAGIPEQTTSARITAALQAAVRRLLARRRVVSPYY